MGCFLPPSSPAARPGRSGLAASLLQALGDEGDSSTAKRLREEIEQLEQQEAELREFHDQEEDDEETMVRTLPPGTPEPLPLPPEFSTPPGGRGTHPQELGGRLRPQAGVLCPGAGL